jgi:glucose/arabinose dehydrogenase
MKFWIKPAFYFALVLTFVFSCQKDDDDLKEMIPETDKDLTTSQIQGYVFRPALVEATDENVKQLKVPSGFSVSKFADQLGKPRMMVVNSNGQVYVTDRDKGTVTLLKDTNGDGTADAKNVVANIKQVHGITIHNGKVYLVAVKEVYSASINADGTLGQPQMLISDLPDGGQHPNRTLAFGPDGMLYITVGSTCNACPEPNKENATILRANPDGTNRKVFAKGLRNTIGFGWHPVTKELYGMDHGIDWLGDNEQKEELNKIVQNGDYGWPYIYGEGKYNPADRPEGDTTYQQYLAKTTLPELTYQAHAAPMGMVFYTGSQFPQEYQNDAFVAMRGSWNRSQPSGYKVVRIHFENNQPAKPAKVDDFLSGFLVNGNKAHFARLVGLAIYTDGSLLVSDDTNGVIYRVAYGSK